MFENVEQIVLENPLEKSDDRVPLPIILLARLAFQYPDIGQDDNKKYQLAFERPNKNIRKHMELVNTSIKTLGCSKSRLFQCIFLTLYIEL